MFWTADTGINGQTPVDLDELDLTGIDPLPSCVWYQDMADFTGTLAGRATPEPVGRKGATPRRGPALLP